jgi:hypothetical protein
MGVVGTCRLGKVRGSYSFSELMAPRPADLEHFVTNVKRPFDVFDSTLA